MQTAGSCATRALCAGLQRPVAVDAEHQIIVAAELSNQAPDVEYFIPMLDQVLVNCEQIPDAALADAGYSGCQCAAGAGAQSRRVSLQHGHRTERNRRSTENPAASVMKGKQCGRLNTDIGDALYPDDAKRSSSRSTARSKPRSGALSLRGLHKARGEWSLIALTHNLLKLRRALAALSGRSGPFDHHPPLFQPCCKARRPHPCQLPRPMDNTPMLTATVS